MLIGIDAHQANKPERTGTEWYTTFLIQAFARQQTEDRFVLYAPTPLVDDLRALGQRCSARVLRWPPRRGWTHTRFSWEMAAHPPDVLFVPAHTVPVFHPRSTVTTIHDVGFLDMPMAYSRGERWYNTASLRWSVRAARHIIVPSAFTKARLRVHCAVPEDRITIIHHGFRPDAFRPVRDDVLHEVLRRYRLAQPYALATGRVEEKKNAGRLIEALNHLLRLEPPSELSLVFAGKPGHGFGSIERRVSENSRLRGRVRFLGYVPNADLPALMTGARLFAFATLYEGFGFPILEAQVCELPVLTSTSGAHPEIGGDGAWYVDPFSVAALADGMQRLHKDEQLRQHLRVRGCANLARFSWDRCAGETLRVLQAAASAR